MATQVLVVDDSASARHRVAEVLAREGITVHEAESGPEGLALLRKKSYALVLVDFNMPGMTGIGMVKAMRALAGYERTPVFMVTTEFDRTLMDKGEKAGVTLWVLKPFKEQQLRDAVCKALGA